MDKAVSARIMHFYRHGLLFIALSISLICETYAQQRRPELEGLDRWCIVPRLGYSYQGSSFFAPGIGLTYVEAKRYFPVLAGGAYASLDFRPVANEFIYAPKVGLEGIFMAFMTGKITFARYINGSESDTRLTPEVGITFFGYLTCCYGLNYKLEPSSTDLVSRHKITVGLNWFIDPWK